MNLIPTDSLTQTKKLRAKEPISRSQPKWLGVWLLSSEFAVESKDLRHHLDWLLNAVIPSEKSLREIQEFQSTKMAISCFWWSNYGDGGPAIWPEQMAMLHRLNLELNISFSYFGDDDSA
jgi:hypothetical protein